MIHHFRVVAMTLAIGLAATSARTQEDTGNVALGKHAAVIEPELGQVVAAPEVVDGDLQTSWVSHFETINQSFEIDLGDAKRVWRVVIHWAPDRFTPAYDIIADGEAFHVDGQDGDIDDIRIPAHRTTDRMRIRLMKPLDVVDHTVEIREIEIYATESFNHVRHNPPASLFQGLPDVMQFAALTDGDHATGIVDAFPTRFPPFLITADPPTPVITRVVLTWGDAFASRYQITDEAGCGFSSVVFEETAGDGGTDVIDLPSAIASPCVGLTILDGHGDHFDLREVEMYGPTRGNVAAGKNTIASSEASEAEASGAAVDLDFSTEWVSAASPDPAWWLVDVGFDPPTAVCGTKIWWGNRFPTSYAVFTLEEGSVTFQPLFANDRGDGGLDILRTDRFPRTRYLVIVAPPTDGGYSIREVEVYRCTADQ